MKQRKHVRIERKDEPSVTGWTIQKKKGGWWSVEVDGERLKVRTSALTFLPDPSLQTPAAGGKHFTWSLPADI
jgi:hypothetical protein